MLGNSEADASPRGHLEIYLDSVSQDNHSTKDVERLPNEDSRSICDLFVNPLSNSHGVSQSQCAVTLQKSFSAKWTQPYSPAQSESDYSRDSSPKSRFSPIRNMFDPIIKSKSRKTPCGSAVGTGRFAPAELAGLSRNRSFRKSLLKNFSKRALNEECHFPSIKKEHYHPFPPCSPSHLRGLLKMQNKHGVPFFEFSVKFSEDEFVAKTWKMADALNWVYTFHSIQNRRKSSTVGRGLKEGSKVSSMVGQMQVSCYLCAEKEDDGVFGNSLVTEFVLYDISRVRKSVTAVDNSKYSPDYCEPHRVATENSSEDRDDLDSSTSHPLAAEELRPNFEIAAIVIQVPFGKRESLKCNSMGGKGDSLSNFLDLSGDEQRRKSIYDCLGTGKVKVVTTYGNHSFPSIESQGPSPLLDRWKFGGGCDCGGWDIACPLTILVNPNIQAAETPVLESHCSLKLYIQGRKDKTPALILNVIGNGQYAIDFHGHFSTLQAFAICVAILHATETSIYIGEERGKQLPHRDSVRVFNGDAVTKEEKRKVSKKIEVLPSFIVDPPFSTVARV